MPILPILVSILPSAIKLAESVFGSGEGASKRALVLQVCGLIYDEWDKSDQKMGDEFISRELFLKIVELLIDILVPKLFPKDA